MTRNPDDGIALTERRLLTRLADYVLPEAGSRLCAIANDCFSKLNLGVECIGSRLSLYMTWCDSDKVYGSLTNRVDSNPHYSLATLLHPFYTPAVARRTLETLNTVYRTQLAATFAYAHQYARQWSNEDDHLVADAERWLTHTGPSLLGNWRPGSTETQEQKEFAATLHHHLVALRSRIPLPGFLSSDLHRCFFESAVGDKSFGRFRAAFVEMKPNAEAAWLWKPTWATPAGAVLTESQHRRQSFPDEEQNPYFNAIQAFILEYLANVFNPGFNGSVPETSKLNQPRSYRCFLALPIFSRQKEDAKGMWHRGGPFLGWILLLLKNKPNNVPSLLKASPSLLEPLNNLAARIQEAREQEFWRHRIPGGLGQKALYRLLRRYAVEFCGAIPKSVLAKSPSVISAASCAEWLDEHPYTVPPFTWKMTWLKTTLDEGSEEDAEEARRTALTRFQEASLRLDEIQESQDAAKHQGRAIAAEEAYSKTAHQLRKLVRGISKNTSDAELDVLRRYFTLTFLSPKNLQGNETIDFATNILTGGAFGPDFLTGRTLEAFICNSYRYSAALYPLMEKLHNKEIISGPKPKRQLVFSKSTIWRAPLWSHLSAVRVAVKKSQLIEGQDAQRLQAKVFSFAALVALWLNTLEHSPNGSKVFLRIEPKTGRLVVKNKAARAVRPSGSEDRSLGTKQTLDYYFQCCFPGGAINGVEFEGKPNRRIFTTKIPIPTKTLLTCQPC